MAAVLQEPQTVYQGVDYLSRNVQSSQLHSPLYLDRITTNQEAYNTFLQDYDVHLAKPKWGSSRPESSLLSIKPLLKSEHDKEYKNHLSHLDKNHLHFGGVGVSYPRVFPTKAQYNVTNLRKSNVRATDELVPNSNKIDVRVAQINHPSSAEHPYSSHASRLEVFPGLGSPGDTKNRPEWTTPCGAPSTAGADVTVTEKIKGSPYRREVMRVTNDFKKKPEEHNQLGFSPEMAKQQYYPGPPNAANPNNWNRTPSFAVSQKTANVLRNLHTLYNTSEYSEEYTGNGQGRPPLDNYDKVMKGRDQPRPRNPDKRCDKNQKSWSDNNNGQAMVDLEKDRPYTSIYKADYATGSYLYNYTTPTSTMKDLKITNTLRNTSTGSKAVKFNNQVVISDGYRTSSGLVNDLNKNVISQPASQLPRPSTAPASRDLLARGRIQDVSGVQTALRPSTTGSRLRLSNQLLELQNNFSKSAAHRQFHCDFPENAPDIRRKPDTRITTNERRHVIPEVGCHSYYFHG